MRLVFVWGCSAVDGSDHPGETTPAIVRAIARTEARCDAISNSARRNASSAVLNDVDL
jgi:hypothetical protein